MTVRIAGYKRSALRRLALLSQPSIFEATSYGEEGEEEDRLSHTVNLQLVEDVTVEPGKGSIFSHRDNKVWSNRLSSAIPFLQSSSEAKLINRAFISPRQSCLIIMFDFQMVLSLIGGSGSFHVDYQPKDVARVEYVPLNRTLQVMPTLFPFVVIYKLT